MEYHARRGWLAAVVIGFIAFWCEFPFSILDPRNLGWLLEADASHTALGWLYFRTSPWTFPLGWLDGYCAPVGTNLAYMDALPAFSVLARLAWLQSADQIMGLWLLLCLILQSLFAAAFFRELKLPWKPSLLGAALFVFSPVLLHRIDFGHLALAAHWLVVAALWLSVRSARLPNRAPWDWVVLLFVASGIHAYIAAMVFAIALWTLAAPLWRPNQSWARRVKSAGIGVTVACISLAGGWYAFGYLTGADNYQSAGFNVLNADILGFFNPMNRTWLLPFIPSKGSGEGFNWLGFGGLLLVLLSLPIPRTRRSTLPWRALSPALLACICLGLFSLGSVIRLWGEPILDLVWLYRPFEFITNTFRSAGRFLWPLGYLVLGLAVVRASTRMPTAWLGRAVLGVAVLLQIADQANQQKARFDHLTRPPSPAPEGQPWDGAGNRFKHLRMIPPTPVGHCGQGRVSDDLRMIPDNAAPYGPFAALTGLTVNVCDIARARTYKLFEACDAQNREIEHGVLDPETIYVVHEHFETWWTEHVGAKTTCTPSGHFKVCIATRM